VPVRVAQLALPALTTMLRQSAREGEVAAASRTERLHAFSAKTPAATAGARDDQGRSGLTWRMPAYVAA
jgi:hypothetical protein